MNDVLGPLAVIVPAAGVGKRMRASCPKQYLTINKMTVIEHTVNRLLSCPEVDKVVIALGANDEYFTGTGLANNPRVETVIGGQERVDSVLAGLKALEPDKYTWALVHDAARPCVPVKDIANLILSCAESQCGGLLAMPVRDTMKRSKANNRVEKTVERDGLWHALTPQMYKVGELIAAIEQGLQKGVIITDESSAMEAAGLPSNLVAGSGKNIKITRPDDLALAEFILSKQQETVCE